MLLSRLPKPGYLVASIGGGQSRFPESKPRVEVILGVFSANGQQRGNLSTNRHRKVITGA